MTAFLIHNMAPIMFAALVLFLLLGYPVAFSLAAVGLPFALIGITMAAPLGRSVGDTYARAFAPGILLAGLYAGYVFIVTRLYPKAAPGLPDAALTHKEPDGTRGVWSLFVVTLIAAIAAYLYMRTTEVKAGADFVVLNMSVAITIAFAFAVLNKLFRLRLLSVLAE